MAWFLVVWLVQVPPGDVGESAPGDGQEAAGLVSHGGDAPAEAERLRAKARLAGLQQEFTGAAGDAFNAELFDAGFDKKGRPVETVAEAELGEEAVPQDKLMELLEPNNPDDDVYVTYEFDDKKPVVKSEPLDSEGGQGGLAEVSGGDSPVVAMLEDDDDDLEGHTMRFVMVEKPTTSSRLHLPVLGATADTAALLVPVPRCGAKGNYSFLQATETLDQATELCLRCFGRRAEGACNRLCNVKLKIGDDLYRCSRRCATECTESGVHLCHVHGF